jgi:1,5-anhydro-D-fructose reductase (1,5-anhydro-D-mannitol-forming)
LPADHSFPAIANVTTSAQTSPDPESWHRRTRHVIGDETLGWAIVGASNMARQHIVPAIRSQPPILETGTRYPVTNSNVVGIFSHDVARARQFSNESLIPHVFVNLADLLNRHDVHCVYVGGHPRHHAQTTLAALAAGKHVLCETPMALSMDEATAMAHTASSAGLQLGVNYVRRADPAVQTMRQLLIKREIGDILGGRMANLVLLEPSLHTWRLQPNGGGVILNRTIHDIDLVRFLLRDEVASVEAHSTLRILGNGVEEDIAAHLVMRRTGRIIELRDSFLIPHNTTRIEIYGSAGTLSAYNCFVDTPDSELFHIQHQRYTALPLDDANLYRDSVDRFNAAVRTLEQPLAGSGDGLRNLEVALAIRESLQTGNRVHIPSDARHIDDRSVV